MGVCRSDTISNSLRNTYEQHSESLSESIWQLKYGTIIWVMLGFQITLYICETTGKLQQMIWRLKAENKNEGLKFRNDLGYVNRSCSNRTNSDPGRGQINNRLMKSMKWGSDKIYIITLLNDEKAEPWVATGLDPAKIDLNPCQQSATRICALHAYKYLKNRSAYQSPHTDIKAAGNRAL